MVDFFLRTLQGVKKLAGGRRPEKAEPKKTESEAPVQEPRREAGASDGASSETGPGENRQPRSGRRRRSGRRPATESAVSDGREPRAEPARPRPESRAEAQSGEGDAPRPRRRRTRKPAGERSAPRAETRKHPTEPWDPATFDVPPEAGRLRFHDLDLPEPIMHAIADLDFRYCTPIQASLLSKTLKGQDAFGKAQTGTGKTAAFLITAFNHLLRNPQADTRPGAPRVLVIAPTRELVLQIERDARDLGPYLDINLLAVFGGTGYQQQQDILRDRVDVLVATPGRLLDFKRKRILDLGQVEILVIDEADRMLDMGFIPDVRSIINSTPPKDRRQTLFFSATLDERVRKLAVQWTKEAITVEIDPEHIANESVDQKVFIVTADQKFPLLVNLLDRLKPQRALIFANRRDATERLLYALLRYEQNTAMLSGALPQNQRTRTLEEFRNGSIRLMVATDVAGRGLHVEGIDLVVNFNLPVEAEDYVHRIGRTGRAGASGTSVSFACEEDSFYIPDIEAYMGKELECVHPEEDWLVAPEPRFEAPRRPPRREHSGGPRRHGGRSSGSGPSHRGGRGGGRHRRR